MKLVNMLNGRNLQTDSSPERKSADVIPAEVKKVEEPVHEKDDIRNASRSNTPVSEGPAGTIQNIEEADAPQRQENVPETLSNDNEDGGSCEEIIENKDESASKGRSDKRTKKKISKPSSFDVLFGRGKPYQGHEGNIRLHKIVNVHKERYLKSRRDDKFAIAEEIVQYIKQGGDGSDGSKSKKQRGRFLKRVDGEEYWVEVRALFRHLIPFSEVFDAVVSLLSMLRFVLLTSIPNVSCLLFLPKLL